MITVTNAMIVLGLVWLGMGLFIGIQDWKAGKYTKTKR